MPDKTADIYKASIEEDQLEVASQWAKTFSHNPQDLATIMTQLVLSCVARGDFKIRDFLASSSELSSPSEHLTIADYLSHGSRIIIDYQSLSAEFASELLEFFPEPTADNKVFSRSATHDVKQVQDKVVEGKGVLLGVKGQLPSLIKQPRDFGLNIAMGGAGQENFYGKLIAANGFSGHFYYHRNTEHQLLLAGLEQTAPASSPLDLLKANLAYPVEVQQGLDQFGQGHSLTGASDTYTVAGSLYFSNPAYQAKLFAEKGIFPPDKYGAMQVSLSDENWPQIKDFLKGLAEAAKKGNIDKLITSLLAKPQSVQNNQRTYLSYVALDFTSYLNQISRLFIEKAELTQDEKSTLAALQINLLASIKEMQFGKLNARDDYGQLMKQILALDNIPEEYKLALSRIDALFTQQFAVDPQLKNTQITRPYQLGDYTWTLLSRIHQAVNGVEAIEEDGQYEFGDITWGMLNRVRAQQKYQLGDFSYGILSRLNHVVNGAEAEYHFGDVVGGLLSKLQPSSAAATTDAPEKPTYRFGDYTRRLIWGANTPRTKLKSQHEDDKDSESDLGLK